MNGKTGYRVKEAADAAGLPRVRIEKLISEGRIGFDDGRIPESDVQALVLEKERYVSLAEYAASRSCGKFDGKNRSHREKLLDFIENQGRFGLETKFPEQMLTGTAGDEEFFLRSDEAVLDEALADFFARFGESPAEKAEKAVSGAKGHAETIRYLREYEEDFAFGKTQTGSWAEFVSAVMNAPDVSVLTNEGVAELFGEISTAAAKDHAVRFLSLVRARRKVRYSNVRRMPKESVSMPAYSDESFLKMARCVFSPAYVKENRLIEKALESHLLAETWLFVALFFCCGWRAEDVCRGWKYLRLSEHDEPPFGLNPETLRDDVLLDRIPEEVYENICRYSLGSIDASCMIPSKTSSFSPPPLTAVITDELMPFYGLLTLIAEVHRLESGDGYMKPERASQYRNRIVLTDFFGPEMGEVLRGRNLMTRRLNKDYLQGIEENARKTGCGGLTASAVASFARSHTNLDTLKSYLKDHRLNGENAEMVLYFMLQRGVFGFEAYQTLITAFPDAMRSLSMKDQTKLIAMMNADPLEIEQTQAGLRAADAVSDSFLRGENEAVRRILMSMFEISQGRGKSKDGGVYCVLRARNEACAYPNFESCLANGCPHLVFTKYGFIPLVKILLEYETAAGSGNRRADGILKNVLLPRYRDVLNSFMNEAGMDRAGRAGLKLLMENTLKGKENADEQSSQEGSG